MCRNHTNENVPNHPLELTKFHYVQSTFIVIYFWYGREKNSKPISTDWIEAGARELKTRREKKTNTYTIRWCCCCACVSVSVFFIGPPSSSSHIFDIRFIEGRRSIRLVELPSRQYSLQSILYGFFERTTSEHNYIYSATHSLMHT